MESLLAIFVGLDATYEARLKVPDSKIWAIKTEKIEIVARPDIDVQLWQHLTLQQNSWSCGSSVFPSSFFRRMFCCMYRTWFAACIRCGDFHLSSCPTPWFVPPELWWSLQIDYPFWRLFACYVIAKKDQRWLAWPAGLTTPDNGTTGHRSGFFQFYQFYALRFRENKTKEIKQILHKNHNNKKVLVDDVIRWSLVTGQKRKNMLWWNFFLLI